MTAEILSVRIHDLTLWSAVERTKQLISERRGAVVCTPNPEILCLSRSEPALRSVLRRADLVLPDGVGVLWAARCLGTPLRERVTGVDLFEALLAEGDWSVFLYGAEPGVAERAAETLRKRNPALRILGTADGYTDEPEAVRERIRALTPDVTAVCLGSPRQEEFIATLSGSPGLGVLAGLGGTLDVIAGKIPRAPEWFIRHRLEWLYRTWKEPKRVWRLLRIPGFMAAVWKQRMS